MIASVQRAIDKGFEFGMYQHPAEIGGFLTWLLSVASPTCIVEIGAHRGGTAAMFCALGTERVISLDWPDGPWGGIGAASARTRDAQLASAWPSYVPVAGDSQDQLTVNRVKYELGEREADLLFVDGDHSYLGAKFDFTHYSTLVRKGGVVAFHDINDTLFHRDRGVMVSKLWRELGGEKHEFTIHADWGGIGAVVL